MPEVQTIKCIKKDDRMDPYERITHVGGTYSGNKRWKITQQQAIGHINSGEWEFYVGSGQNRVMVIVAKSPYGNDYIRTEADGKEPNNLLSLPECL